MKNGDDFQLDQIPRTGRPTTGLDPLAILQLLKKNWYYLVISMVVALLGAYIYIGHTLPVFRSSATILVNETENRPLVDNSDILQGLGLPGGMENIQNQMMVLKSRALVEKTLKDLPFETEFYIKTLKNRLPIYPEHPIRIASDGVLPLPRDTEFLIEYIGSTGFTISSESELYPFRKTAAWGENIDIAGGSFRVEIRDETWFAKHPDVKLCFVIHSLTNLTNYFMGRLNVELVSRDGSIVMISMQGTNCAMDVDFINRHIEGFQAISLDKKNREAERRIQFIDDQLVGISDSLSHTENRLQQFRSSNRVMDISAQGQAIIGQVTLLENERARLSLEANYYDYLADYLDKETGEIPIVPITMGITDPGLTRLVEELADLQGQLSGRGAGEMNPLQKNIEQRIRTTKDALKETLNGLRRANSLARSENQDQISRANSQASALPVTERQLLGIERKFKVNDELYTFLLETRAEQQMQKASNKADSEVIDPADERFSYIVAPDPIKIYFVGLFAGAGIPFLVMFLGFVFNKKLKEEDVRRITDMPVVGNIPHYSEKSNLAVFNFPDSSMAEAFRLLRSRMQFLTKDEACPVILVTSSIAGEGKTLTAINIASAYSLLGQKTVLVGFDLRKPKIYQDFNLGNEKGTSTFLIGKDKLPDIIQPTEYENLSIISAGPIPPNPSELTALKKTEELILQLKEKFDYIIIDSSPIGIVSDTYHLASFADACLIIVRPEHTLKTMLEITINEIRASDIKSPSLVINDITSDSKHYRYGDKYGYTNKKSDTKRGWLRRRRSRR